MSTTMTAAPSPAPFERARSAAQRHDRVSRLINATYELLVQSPARTITLGQIGSAAGLAKSGVLRYAGSLEALLLRVMYEEHLAWTDSLRDVLASGEGWTPNRIAQALARSLADRPVLCDLICTSPVLMGKAGADDHAVVREQGRDIQVRLGACLAPVLLLSDDELRMLTAALHAFTGTAWAWATPGAEGIPIVSDFETTLSALIGTYIRGIR
jgi:AcrR family transcriptional regulator